MVGVTALFIGSQANAQKLLVVNPNCSEGELQGWPGWTQVTAISSSQFLTQGCSGGFDVVEIGCVDFNITSAGGQQLINNLVQSGVGIYSLINLGEDASWVPGGITVSQTDSCTDNVAIPLPALTHPIITFPNPDLTVADFAPVGCAVHGSYAGTSAAYDAILMSNDSGFPVILASNSFPGRVVIRGQHHHFLGDPGALRVNDSIANWLLGGTPSTTDGDGDGVPDACDNCPMLSNPGQEDTDHNGVGDACNDGEDSDGDEWADGLDNCPAISNPSQQDSDFDGVGDACDPCFGFGSTDSDGDGFCDGNDNCPSIANPDQADADFDGFGDACDACAGPGTVDSDADTICDPNDNCPTIANAGQEDSNSDAVGDACSPQVSIGPITSDGANQTATVIVGSPLQLPLSGTVRVCDSIDATALSFTWLATRCGGTENLALTVNGVTVATRPLNPNFPTCTCTPQVDTYTVPISTVAALLRPGENSIGIQKSGSASALLAWAYATLTTSQGSQRVEIFDENGGNSYDDPDLCNSGFTSGSLISAATADLCDPVASESWSGTLPCALDVSGLGNQEYELVVTATDGFVGSPSRDAATFFHASETNLFINSNCELACDEMTDQCISVCPASPRTGCKTPGRSLFLRKRSSDGSRDKFLWTWLRGQATTVHDFGHPDDTADYVLCMYSGTPATLMPGGQIVVPKSSNWNSVGGASWAYDDGTAAADGVRKMTLRGSGQDKVRATVKGKGVHLPDPSLPLVPANFPLVVQLLNSETSTCLQSAFTAADVSKNDEGNLKAKH